MIKNSGSKYDNYSVSPKIRQNLLHWGYEQTKKDFELINKNKRLKRILQMRNEKAEMTMTMRNEK